MFCAKTDIPAGTEAARPGGDESIVVSVSNHSVVSNRPNAVTALALILARQAAGEFSAAFSRSMTVKGESMPRTKTAAARTNVQPDLSQD
jgi:hypothetical protein